MITNSTTTSKIEKLEDNLNEEIIDDYLHTIQERASADIDPVQTQMQSIKFFMINIMLISHFFHF